MQQKNKVGGPLPKYSTVISSGYTNNIVALIYLERLSHLCTAATAAPKAEKEPAHTRQETTYLLSLADTVHDDLWIEQKFCIVFKYISSNGDFHKA